jgi:hypothetical protein
MVVGEWKIRVKHLSLARVFAFNEVFAFTIAKCLDEDSFSQSKTHPNFITREGFTANQILNSVTPKN